MQFSSSSPIRRETGLLTRLHSWRIIRISHIAHCARLVAGRELGLPGYDPLGPEGADANLLVSNEALDLISGSVPHRS